MTARLRRQVHAAMASGFWKPSNMVLLLRGEGAGRPVPPVDRLLHLRAALDWLRDAQDAVADGGVSWGYQLRRGWMPSYPETTGYIIPTLLDLARLGHGADLQGRAERCVEFVARVQLPDGSFPAGTEAGARARPSVFNTGQIICGLTAWYRETGDEQVRAMACDAARWLIGVQDEDGAWRRHGYLDYPVTYTAHASCWVAELGVLIGEAAFTQAASRHLDWVLSQQDMSSGWFERSGFSTADHVARRAVTHTLAYTLWGAIHAGIALGREDAVAAARRPARHVAQLAESRGRLPGMVDATWTLDVRYSCLTGNAQMALIWMRLDELDPEAVLSRATEIVLDRVAEAQLLREKRSGLRGGVPGSDPIWGDYVPFAVPNWSAKFYLDALMARDHLSEPSGGSRSEA